MTHICVGNLTIIGSENGLSYGRRQAIIQTNAWILLMEHLGKNFSGILIEILTSSFKKMRLKVSSAAILSRRRRVKEKRGDQWSASGNGLPAYRRNTTCIPLVNTRQWLSSSNHTNARRFCLKWRVMTRKDLLNVMFMKTTNPELYPHVSIHQFAGRTNCNIPLPYLCW